MISAAGLQDSTHGTPPRRVVLVTGLSGAGKASTLRILEDLGFEAVDNPPVRLMEELVERGEGPTAIGVDARTRGFDAQEILAGIARLKCNPALRPELVFLFADVPVLLRRYTETRRRHPMAPTSRVVDGVTAETALTAPLREAADLLLDTSDLPLPMLRRIIEQRFSGSIESQSGMTVSLMSFAYPHGLPREAELVFDARFLRNPHYVPILRDRTGLEADVAAYVEADPDFWPFVEKITDLLILLLPRFIQEGKKYVSIAIGCTGGQHRSVHLVQVLAERLRKARAELGGGWRVGVTHRELMQAAAGQARRVAAAPAVEGLETDKVVEQQGSMPRNPGAGGLTETP